MSESLAAGSGDDQTQNARPNCPVCVEIRPVPQHLHEVALACDYLQNTSTYTGSDSSREASTLAISEWLKLASQLKSVAVDKWKFHHDPGMFMCGSAGDYIDSESAHYTYYATAMTRFLFVANALEETYRFVDRHFDSFADARGLAKADRPRSSSVRAAMLVDGLPEDRLPKHLRHNITSYSRAYGPCAEFYRGALSGMRYADKSKAGYALHLVRNVRNHLAHGVFPIAPNPEYSFGDGESREPLMELLGHSCRMAAMYIQCLLFAFNDGFKSPEFRYREEACDEDDDKRAQWFTANCTRDYLLTLHLKGDFCLAEVDVSSCLWDDEDE